MWAAAGGVDGRLVGLVAAVAQAQVAKAGEEVAVARIAGGHHAVEHVDALAHAFHQIFRRAHAHQVARLVGRQLVADVAEDALHLGLGLADRQAADGVAGQVQLRQARQRRVRRCSNMPPCTMPNSALGFSQALELIDAALGPAQESSIEALASRSVVSLPLVSYGVHSSNCMTMSEFSTVWICMLTSGVRKSLSPLTGEANLTPSSLILRISPKDQTWKPPESVRMGLLQLSKRCSPPNCHDVQARPHPQVEGVAEDDLRAHLLQRARHHAPLTVP